MTGEQADDIVDAWHEGLYPPDWGLMDVFMAFGWSYRDYDYWVRTGKTPDE